MGSGDSIPVGRESVLEGWLGEGVRGGRLEAFGSSDEDYVNR